MRNPRCLLGLLILLAVPLSLREAQSADLGGPRVVGRWLAQNRDGVFEIAHCGESLCGRLVGLQYESEIPKDILGRSQCNLLMLRDFRSGEDKKWHGHIFDPESGRTYDSQIWLSQPDVLKLRGYILGWPLLGQTQTWTRYNGKIGPNCKLPV